MGLELVRQVLGVTATVAVKVDQAAQVEESGLVDDLWPALAAIGFGVFIWVVGVDPSDRIRNRGPTIDLAGLGRLVQCLSDG